MDYCAYFKESFTLFSFIAIILVALHYNRINDEHYSRKWLYYNCYKSEVSKHGCKVCSLLNDSKNETLNPRLFLRCKPNCLLSPWKTDRHYLGLWFSFDTNENNDQCTPIYLLQNIINLICWTFGVKVLMICVCCFKLFELKKHKKRRGTILFTSFKKKKFRCYFRNQMLMLRKGPKQILFVYPFSLNQYADEIVKDHRPSEDLMKYEWSRYLSFKTFPQDSVMTPIRLSQAGFYYTGHDEEVKCFSCGVTNGHWTLGETAIGVHKRLSPRCRFISGVGTDNIGIHFNEYYDDIFRDMRAVCSHNKMETEVGASGQTMDNDNGLTQTKKSTRTHEHSKKDTPQQKSTDKEYKPKDNAKHPDYADEAIRIMSYNDWGLSNTLEPQRMAQAGFFYTGVRDFVRCFYCGVGLKNWQGGDDPNSEHRRWSPRCGFLAQLQNREPVQVPTNTQRAASSATTTPEPKNNVQHSFAVNSSPTSGPVTMSTKDTAYTNSDCEMIYNRDTVEERPEEERRQFDIGNHQMSHVQSHTVVDEYTVESRVGSLNSVTSAANIKENCTTNGPNDRRESNPARLLREQNQQLRQLKSCKVCMISDANMVFLPCGHMVSCQACSVTATICVICRTQVKGTVRVYQS